MKTIFALCLTAVAATGADTNPVMFVSREQAIWHAGADVTFTNRIETFTNRQGKAYERVNLDRTEKGFLYFDFVESSGGGRVKLTDIKDEDAERFGLRGTVAAAGLVAEKQKEYDVANAAVRERAAADARRTKEQQALPDMVKIALKADLVTKIEYDDDLIKAWVGVEFYSLDFDAKKNLAIVIYSERGFDPTKNKSAQVSFRDRRTGKEVAILDAFGFRAR